MRPPRLVRRPRFRSWTLASVLSCGFLVAAAQPGPVVAADADTLLRDGIALRRVGKDVAALKKFEEANAIQPSVRAVAQIGFAEQALGRWGAADRHLRAALAASDDPWVGRNRKSIEQSLEIVAQHVGRLEIMGSPTGGEVLVDGELVGQLPLGGPIAATAGGVAIEVRAPGYVSVVRSARIVVGGLTRESFNLQPTASSSETTAGAVAGRRDGATAVAITRGPSEAHDAVVATAGSSSTGQAGPREQQPPSSGGTAASSAGMPPGRIAALVAAGLSAGALAAGIYEHVHWQDRVSAFQNDMTCDLTATGRGSTACQSLYDDGQKARTLAFVGYGFAGAFAATAVVLYLVTPDSASAATTVACAPEAGSFGLTCGGRF